MGAEEQGAPETPATPERSQPTFVGTATGQPIGLPAAPPAAPVAAPPPADEPKRTMTSTMPAEVLAVRLEEERAKERKRLLAEFGVEDPQAFKAQREKERQELEAHRKREEAAKRARMSEVEKAKADLEAERKLREQLQRDIEQEREGRASDQQEIVVRGKMGKYIAPDHVDYVAFRFAKHVTDLGKTNPAEVDTIDEAYLEKWFKEFAKKHPAFALQGQGAPTAPVRAVAGTRPTNGTAPRTATVTPLQRPMGTTVQPRRPAPVTPATQLATAKTPRPGQPNSMNKQELAEHMRKQGLKPL